MVTPSIVSRWPVGVRPRKSPSCTASYFHTTAVGPSSEGTVESIRAKPWPAGLNAPRRPRSRSAWTMSNTSGSSGRSDMVASSGDVRKARGVGAAVDQAGRDGGEARPSDEQRAKGRQRDVAHGGRGRRRHAVAFVAWVGDDPHALVPGGRHRVDARVATGARVVEHDR